MVLRPVQSLIVYLLVLMLYPSYLAVEIGTAQVTAGRVVGTLLLVRALVGTWHARVRLRTLDWLVIGLYGWGTFALLVTEGGFPVIENRVGVLMDMVFPYLAARLIVKDKDDLLTVAKWAAAIVVLLAVLGVVESVSGWSPYAQMKNYAVIKSTGGPVGQRWGLYRAEGPVGLHIAFGMCFVALLPLILTQAREQSWKLGWATAVIAAVAGTFSSMSGGPLLCFFVFAVCVGLSWRPTLVKPALILTGLLLLAIEIASTRHFYYVLSRLAFDSRTAWYRARLIDVAFEKLPDYWLLGYGWAKPNWGMEIDMRQLTDILNEYILQAAAYGAMAAVLFVGIIWKSISRLRDAYKWADSALVRKSAWYFGSMVVGFAAALCSVGLLGTAQVLFYTVMGVIGADVFNSVRQAPRNYLGGHQAGAIRAE